MTTFTEFADRLARGQLRNTSYTSETSDGKIKAKYHDDILEYLNQGLVDLSTRVNLINRMVDLTFEDGVNQYPLVDTALSSYLDDTSTEPFEGFLSVMEVIDATGCIHNVDTNGHITTPTYNVLRFTTDKMLKLAPKVRIRYKAQHPSIDTEGSFDIPPFLVNALQLFVSGLAIGHMGGEEHQKTGDRFYGAYLRHLQTDDEKNQSSTSEIHKDTRFADKGFV